MSGDLPFGDADEYVFVHRNGLCDFTLNLSIALSRPIAHLIRVPLEGR